MILPVAYWGMDMEIFAMLTFMGGVLVGIGMLLLVITAVVYFFTREET
jgi:uncharacterized membrane protein